MYIYQSYKPIKKKNKVLFYIFTFIFAVLGAYLFQTFFNSKVESEENIQRLSEEINIKEPVNYNLNTRENIIEETMKSVVGISIIQANEESIFDISLSEKWGLRHGNNYF